MISDLKVGSSFEDCYLVSDTQCLITKDNKPYFKVVFSDLSGEMNCLFWNEKSMPFKKGDIVFAKGQITDYKGALQMNVTDYRLANSNEYNLNDFYRTTQKDKTELYQYIQNCIDCMDNVYLKQLLSSFYPTEGPQKDKFMAHPAAKGFHHNYDGGLLEHTASVAKIAMGMVDQYPNVNRDLVLTGALLHDIGKTEELTPVPNIDYSKSGRLMGHLVIGTMMIAKRITTLFNDEFPEDLRIQLFHIILSHHGELEFGSPVVPQTAEAMIVHLADDADAKLKETDDAIHLDKNEGDFTAFNQALKRYFFKG